MALNPLVPQLELADFKSRKDRTSFLVDQFSRRLNGRLLDVGCDEAPLRDLLPQVDYVGIDIGGNPTIRINLETESFPFKANEFDAVVCCDVLEHIDSLHRVFEEIVRVTKPGGFIVISLPNNWVNARRPIERGKGSFMFYGLPAERPVDRHKWFFSLADAMAFYEAQTHRYPLRLVETLANAKRRNPVTNFLRRIRYAPMNYLNRYAHTVWAVFEKIR